MGNPAEAKRWHRVSHVATIASRELCRVSFEQSSQTSERSWSYSDITLDKCARWAVLPGLWDSSMALQSSLFRAVSQASGPSCTRRCLCRAANEKHVIVGAGLAGVATAYLLLVCARNSLSADRATFLPASSSRTDPTVSQQGMHAFNFLQVNVWAVPNGHTTAL